VEPIPPEIRDVRLVVPLLAQDASYFAASARIASLVAISIASNLRMLRTDRCRFLAVLRSIFVRITFHLWP